MEARGQLPTLPIGKSGPGVICLGAHTWESKEATIVLIFMTGLITDL